MPVSVVSSSTNPQVVVRSYKYESKSKRVCCCHRQRPLSSSLNGAAAVRFYATELKVIKKTRAHYTPHSGENVYNNEYIRSHARRQSTKGNVGFATRAGTSPGNSFVRRQTQKCANSVFANFSMHSMRAKVCALSMGLQSVSNYESGTIQCNC